MTIPRVELHNHWAFGNRMYLLGGRVHLQLPSATNWSQFFPKSKRFIIFRSLTYTPYLSLSLSLSIYLVKINAKSEIIIGNERSNVLVPTDNDRVHQATFSSLSPSVMSVPT